MMITLTQSDLDALWRRAVETARTKCLFSILSLFFSAEVDGTGEVEQVARALCESGGYFWDKLADNDAITVSDEWYGSLVTRDDFRRDARAAIATMMQVMMQAKKPDADLLSQIDALKRERATLRAYAFELSNAIGNLIGGGSEMLANCILAGTPDEFFTLDIPRCIGRLQSRFTSSEERAEKSLLDARKLKQQLEKLANHTDALGFSIGDSVIKTSGKYHPVGRYRGYVHSSDGDLQLIVEHAYGMLHIYSVGEVAKADASGDKEELRTS